MDCGELSKYDPALGQLGGASFDSTCQYRYLLWRTWDTSRLPLLWVLLNPSTADAGHDDNTISHCIRYSTMWGYGGLEVVNLFAYKSFDPKKMRHALNPVGPENDCYIIAAAKRATGIIVGWGEHGDHQRRDLAVLTLLRQHATAPLWCLGKTTNGQPRHPARKPNNAERMPYIGTEETNNDKA